ncbi:unnamed protein product [Closterium sp. NIES-54]
MALLRVLPFDPEGRPVAFDRWHDDLQLYLLSDSQDSVSLFDLVSGAAPAPPSTADVSTRSQWLPRDATARLAIRNHLPATTCAHFGEHRTAQALYDGVVARYSSPATTALGRLLLPYLFPELSAFATVVDLVTHLRTSDARYRTTILPDFLLTNQPPMFITLYFIVSRLPDSLCSVRDHFLTLDPTSLTVDLLEQHLLAAETSAVDVGAARGTPRSPFFEGCSPSPLSSSFASAAAADVSVPEDVTLVVEVAVGVAVGAAVEEAEVVEVMAAMEAAEGVAAVEAVGPVVVGLDLSVEALVAVGASSSSVGARLRRLSSSVSGWFSVGRASVVRPARMSFARVPVRARHVGGFTLGAAALPALTTPGTLSLVMTSSALAGRSCLAAAALGASASGTPPGTAPAEALHTFTLDSGASRCFFRDSTTLTPLPAPVPVRLADPFGGPVVASSSTVLPCPAVPSGSLSGLHLPSFSTNLVSTAPLQDANVTTTTPGGQRVSICTCTQTGRHLATFTRRPGSSLYTLATEPPQVAASAQVSASGQVAASSSCRLLSHQTLLWHHRLGHPSLPRLCGMHSRLLVSGLPRSLPPLPPSPAPPCLPCIEGRQSAAPHSSSFPPTIAPLQTLHMDVRGPARVSGQGHERYFLLVDLPVLRLHSDKGGEFSSDLLRDSCRGEGITQSFTLPDSPQQNGIAEHRIGLVMEVARTSMIHATAPHFLWPFAVGYAAHLLNLWPRVSLPETSPTLRWTGKVGDASVFQVWGSRAFVRDTSADKLSARAIPCGPAPSGVSQVDPLLGTVPVQGAGSGGAEPEGVEPGGAESEGAEPEGAESEGAESGGAEPRGAASSGGPTSASPRLSSQQLREWLVQRAHRRSGAPEAGEPGGAAVTTGVGDPMEPGAAGAGGAGAGVAGVGGRGAGGAGAAGAGAVALVQEPASPLPYASPYTEQSGGLTERREPASRPVSPVCIALRAPRSRPPPVPVTHTMALHPSSVPLRVPLPAPPEFSLPEVPDPGSDRAHAASPTVARLLATAVIDPSFESAAAFALVAELLDFAAACRLDYASALVAESVPASPPSVGGECALGTDVLEDRQEEFECLAPGVPRFASVKLISHSLSRL